jgi:hypothetical protein
MASQRLINEGEDYNHTIEGVNAINNAALY